MARRTPKTVYKFYKQLNIGDAGEANIKAAFPHIEKSKDLAYDFIGKNNKKVEVKTDNFDMRVTPNFFMEKYSDDSQKLGGPYRALRDSVDVYVYYFINNKTVFIFGNIKRLVNFIDHYVECRNIPLIEVKNDGYSTWGYKIPRRELLDQCLTIPLG